MVLVDADFAMRADALEAMMAADVAAGLVPLIVTATMGTTSSTACDPLRAIGEVAQRHGAWYHIDAAYGGSAAIVPEFRPLLDGVELADSMVTNPHKWLMTNVDCSAYFVRDVDAPLETFATAPAYLRTRHDADVVNYRDWGIPLGRRMRALKLWFLIREQGLSGLQARLRRDLENARWLADQVAAAPGWRVLAPVPLQTLCVRHEPPGISGEALDRHTQAWCDRLNRSGQAYLTPATLDGRWMVRVSIGSEQTERPHVERLWAAMQHEVTR